MCALKSSKKEILWWFGLSKFSQTDMKANSDNFQKCEMTENNENLKKKRSWKISNCYDDNITSPTRRL